MYGNLIPIFNVSFSRKTRIINNKNNNIMNEEVYQILCRNIETCEIGRAHV